MKTRLVVIAMVLAALVGLGEGGRRVLKSMTTQAGSDLPVTKVRRGRVTIAVSARGDLQGGKSEMLVVPMTGVDSTAITYLREPGELVKAGDTIVEFDTTQQEYTLREAQADLAEAEQQVIQAQATSQAADEENQYALEAAKSAVTLADLEVRKNPVKAAVEARQNEISLEAAQGRLHQAEQNLSNKNANGVAGIAIQQANLTKAKVTADMTQKIIDGMTLKAATSGYVAVQPNTNVNMWYVGMTFQMLQLGDTVYSGQPVAEIPDLKNWEVSAHVGELDRGHLNPGQKVTISVVALPGKSFPGVVKSVGGTTGPPWDRRFECRITLEQPSPELRPGMTSNMVITTDALENVNWIPSQALYENGGKTFVYLATAKGFVVHDVTLVNRSESQAVIQGLQEGDVVAMTNPDQQNRSASDQQSGAMKALQK